jgi:hypothetical protein
MKDESLLTLEDTGEFFNLIVELSLTEQGKNDGEGHFCVSFK